MAGAASALPVQEEERERRMDFIPDESAINTDAIEVDKDTMDMLRGMNMAGLPGITVQQVKGGGMGVWGMQFAGGLAEPPAVGPLACSGRCGVLHLVLTLDSFVMLAAGPQRLPEARRLPAAPAPPVSRG
jgi:hypothetical protein